MALATRPKPKAFQKKRVAQHHRHSKLYVKPYLPYLPVLAILVMGATVNKMWADSDKAVASFSPSLGTARLALITGSSSKTALYAVLAVTLVAIAIFVGLHWYRVQRVLNRGEKFAVDHPWIDIALAFIITAGVVLTRP